MRSFVISIFALFWTTVGYSNSGSIRILATVDLNAQPIQGLVQKIGNDPALVFKTLLSNIFPADSFQVKTTTLSGADIAIQGHQFPYHTKTLVELDLSIDALREFVATKYNGQTNNLWDIFENVQMGFIGMIDFLIPTRFKYVGLTPTEAAPYPCDSLLTI